MLIDTEMLSGASLDWAVAKATHQGGPGVDRVAKCVTVIEEMDFFEVCFEPSTSWQDGGPLIDKYDVMFERFNGRLEAIAIGGTWMPGESRLESAMRAIVRAELGGSVDVPDALAK